MRAQEFLAELFTSGEPWKWSFRGSEEAVAVFHVDGVPYKFYAYMYPETPTSWEVEFEDATRGLTRTQKFGLTGKGNSAKVMATVVDIMGAFLKEYQSKITKLTFSAKEDSRQGLYAKMAHRLLPTWHIEQVGGAFELTAPTTPEENK